MGDGKSEKGVVRDPRDASAPEWSYPRYKQNRMAVSGFRRVLEIVDRYMQTARYSYTYFDVEAYKRHVKHVGEQSYRLVDELARLGALDLVSVGITVEQDEIAAEKRE